MKNVDVEILDQMDFSSKNACFITLKNYQEKFLNDHTVGLNNPAKNELRRIRKAVLDNISKCLCTNLNINQWKK